VPLRSLSLPKLSLSITPGRLAVEGFHYPHGCAVVGTLSLEGDYTLEAAVDATLGFWNDQTQAKWPTGATESLRCKDLGARLLTTLAQEAGGEIATSGERFSIGTIMEAAGVYPSEAIPDGGDLHRALEAWCYWQPDTWRAASLPHLAEHRLDSKAPAIPGHCLYAQPQARVIWFPAYFPTKDKPRHTLSCYHRNLTLGHLQTEGLSRLLQLIADQLKDQGELDPTQLQLAQNALRQLGKLWGKSDKTYRSASLRARIDQLWPAATIQPLAHQLGRPWPV
jgi:hypothetical protein